MELIQARAEQKDALCRFYEEVCREQEGRDNGPLWHYGVYPDPEELREHVDRGEIFCALRGGRMALSLVLKRGEDPEYRDVPFTRREEPIAVLHLFAVHPDFRGQGLAKAGLRALRELLHAEGVGSLHLDVVKGNRAAERLYQGEGFRFVQEREVYYEDTGALLVRLYEYDF